MQILVHEFVGILLAIVLCLLANNTSAENLCICKNKVQQFQFYLLRISTIE
jgi:hypothetical protein